MIGIEKLYILPSRGRLSNETCLFCLFPLITVQIYGFCWSVDRKFYWEHICFIPVSFTTKGSTTLAFLSKETIIYLNKVWGMDNGSFMYQLPLIIRL
jgi:hypothetical protein